jgi:hypothetical protein
MFADCAELAEAGMFVNLTKDIGKPIFFRICGNKPGVVWNMDAGQQRNGESAGQQRNGESHQFGLLDFFKTVNEKYVVGSAG